MYSWCSHSYNKPGFCWFSLNEKGLRSSDCNLHDLLYTYTPTSFQASQTPKKLHMIVHVYVVWVGGYRHNITVYCISCTYKFIPPQGRYSHNVVWIQLRNNACWAKQLAFYQIFITIDIVIKKLDNDNKYLLQLTMNQLLELAHASRTNLSRTTHCYVRHRGLLWLAEELNLSILYLLSHAIRTIYRMATLTKRRGTN